MVEDKSHPPLCGGSGRKIDPLLDPAYELLHPLGDGNVPLALRARLVAALRGTERHHLDYTEKLGHRNVPGDVAPAHPLGIGSPLGFSPVIENQGVKNRYAEFRERLGEGIGVTGRGERSCVDERRDPARKEGVYHLPIRPRPDLLIGHPEAEYRENVVIPLKFPYQGILDGQIPVHPVRPGKKDADADAVPGRIPGEVHVRVVEDRTDVRVIDPLPASLMRRVVDDVRPNHLRLDVPDQVPDVQRSAIEEVGAHRGDDGKRDGRGRPGGVGVAERYHRNALRETAQDLVPDGVVRRMD
ncbi:hypothetical protein DSECCO2_625280 [anaerobic digester metagenome]